MVTIESTPDMATKVYETMESNLEIVRRRLRKPLTLADKVIIIDVKDGACVDVCPVDCIYTTDEDNMYFINPDECIDCAACEPVCPVVAIFAEDDVPGDQRQFIDVNYEYFGLSR